MRRAVEIVLVVFVALGVATGVGCASTQASVDVKAAGATQAAPSGSTSSTAPAPTTQSRPTPVGPKRVRIGVNGQVPGTELHALVARQIKAAGGVPVRMRAGNLDVGSVDGIVLVGGADIDPSRYGEATDPKTSVVGSAREKYDLALTKAALDHGVPILGICLGAQEIWVVRGGTLVQDIPSEVGTSVNHRARAAGQKVSLAAGSTLADIYGSQRLRVYSNHHQSADGANVPEGLRVTANSSDGVVEGFESASPTNFVIGVNWHPEHNNETTLFKALVKAARENKVRIAAGSTSP
jgi:gamma-glutamyl-gamma-aminobutyrate hydrolase PuuD